MDAFIADKSLLEFIAVVTDSRRVENPVSIDESSNIVNLIYQSAVRILFSTPYTLQKTIELAGKYKIVRQKIFDTILVAIMLENEIETIYTANTKDFELFDEINVINPLIKRA